MEPLQIKGCDAERLFVKMTYVNKRTDSEQSYSLPICFFHKKNLSRNTCSMHLIKKKFFLLSYLVGASACLDPQLPKARLGRMAVCGDRYFQYGWYPSHVSGEVCLPAENLHQHDAR